MSVKISVAKPVKFTTREGRQHKIDVARPQPQDRKPQEKIITDFHKEAGFGHRPQRWQKPVCDKRFQDTPPTAVTAAPQRALTVVETHFPLAGMVLVRDAEAIAEVGRHRSLALRQAPKLQRGDDPNVRSPLQINNTVRRTAEFTEAQQWVEAFLAEPDTEKALGDLRAVLGDDRTVSYTTKWRTVAVGHNEAGYFEEVESDFGTVRIRIALADRFQNLDSRLRAGETITSRRTIRMSYVENLILPLIATSVAQNPGRAVLAMMMIAGRYPQYRTYVDALLNMQDLPHGAGLRLFWIWHTQGLDEFLPRLAQARTDAQEDFLRVAVWLARAGLTPQDAFNERLTDLLTRLEGNPDAPRQITDFVMAADAERFVIRIGGISYYASSRVSFYNDMARLFFNRSANLGSEIDLWRYEYGQWQAQRRGFSLRDLLANMNAQQMSDFYQALQRQISSESPRRHQQLFTHEVDGNLYVVSTPDTSMTIYSSDVIQRRNHYSAAAYQGAFAEDFNSRSARIIRISSRSGQGYDMAVMTGENLDDATRTQLLAALTLQAVEYYETQTGRRSRPR